METGKSSVEHADSPHTVYNSPVFTTNRREWATQPNSCHAVCEFFRVKLNTLTLSGMHYNAGPLMVRNHASWRRGVFWYNSPREDSVVLTVLSFWGCHACE